MVGPTTVIEAFNLARIDYVIVGGIATILHGFMRTTGDLDLMIDLRRENIESSAAVFARLGVIPRPPVAFENLADVSIRESWIRDKAMKVFSMFDPRMPSLEIDILLESPIPFQELYERAVLKPLGKIAAKVCSLDDLIAMKTYANRPVDRRDIEVLREIKKNAGM